VLSKVVAALPKPSSGRGKSTDPLPITILFNDRLDRKQIVSPVLLAYFAGTKMLALISGMLMYG
jgi:hypothetical protein